MASDLERKVRDATVRHQVLLERVKEGEAEAAEAAESLTEEAALAILATTLLDLSDLKKNEADQLAARLGADVLRRHDDYVQDFLRRMSDLADYEYAFEARTLRRVYGMDVPSRTGLLSDVMDRRMAHDGQTVSEFLGAWRSSEERAYRNAATKAWIEGDDIARAIRGTASMAFADGVSRQVANWRKTNVKTLMQHVSATAKLSLWLAAPEAQRYRWISILDSRTTEICRGRANRIYVVGEGPIPPAHHNCRSTIALLPNG